jgi:hypothetical protein
VELFETICRAPGCTTSADRLATLRRLFNDRPKFLLCRHVLSSHEHIAVSSEFFHYSGAPILQAVPSAGISVGVMESWSDAAILRYQSLITNHRSLGNAGGVAERLIAPVLKTGRPKGLVSSNLTPSALSIFDCRLAISDWQQ